jgi:hypothetical protein
LITRGHRLLAYRRQNVLALGIAIGLLFFLHRQRRDALGVDGDGFGQIESIQFGLKRRTRWVLLFFRVPAERICRAGKATGVISIDG